MDSVIEIAVINELYFTARTTCGESWPGMRHTDDVRIITERAMDHTDKCQNCKPKTRT